MKFMIMGALSVYPTLQASQKTAEFTLEKESNLPKLLYLTNSLSTYPWCIFDKLETKPNLKNILLL